MNNLFQSHKLILFQKYDFCSLINPSFLKFIFRDRWIIQLLYPVRLKHKTKIWKEWKEKLWRSWLQQRMAQIIHQMSGRNSVSELYYGDTASKYFFIHRSRPFFIYLWSNFRPGRDKLADILESKLLLTKF